MYADALSVRGQWRAHFQIPRTDPRYLASTDEDMIADLLEVVFLAGERRRSDPREREMERVLRDPDAARAEDDVLAAELAPGGRLYERAIAFERNQREDPSPRITSIRTRARPA